MNTYRIIERTSKCKIDEEVVVFADNDGSYIRARVKAGCGESIAQSEILEVYRKMKPEEVYPATIDSDTADELPEEFYLKKVKLIDSNPWKFNTIFSVRREITSLKSIQHPNIVKFFGVKVENGLVKGLYLEKYDMTLMYMIDEKISFDRLAFMKKLVEVVDFMRSLGFVHGDIHDENIMVKESDTSFPYLIDFDACEVAGTEMITTTKTFGEPRSNIITYGCDSSALIKIFKLLF